MDYLSALETNDQSISYTLGQLLLVLDARAENASVLYRIADYVENRWPNFPSARPLLEALYAKRLDDAFVLLVEMEENMPRQNGFPFRFYMPELDEALKGPRSRLLEAVVAGEPVDQDLARAAYEREYSRYFYFQRNSPEKLERQIKVLEKLIDLDPDPARYRADRINAWLLVGYANRAGEAIAEQYANAPEDTEWRLAHFLFLKAQQRFDEALAVVTDGGPDLTDPAVLQRLMLQQQRGFGPMRSIFGQLQAMASASASGSAVAAAPVGMMPFVAPGSGDRRKGAVQRLNEALNDGDHELGRQALREAWRRLSVPQDSPYGPPPGSMPLTYLAQNLLNSHLQAPGQSVPGRAGGGIFGGGAIFIAAPVMPVSASLDEEAPEPRMLFDAVAEAPYGAAELDGFLRATPDRERTDFHQLYGFMAKAAENGDRLEELWKRLNDRAIDDHEFTLWMLLRDRQKVEFGPGGLEAFERRVAAISDPSPYQLLLAARVFATAGAVEQAMEYYKLAAARRIQHNEYGDRQRVFFGFRPAGPSFADLLEMMSEAGRRLPPEAASEVVDAVLLLARRAEEIPGADALFDAFLLAALEKVYSPEELFGQARRRSSGVLELPDHLYESGAVKAAELARAYARAGDLDRAVEIFGAMLMEEGPGALSLEELQNPQAFARTQALSSLSLLYGLPAVTQPYQYLNQGLTAAQEILRRMERLFPSDAEDWAGAGEWTRAATDALLGWLAAGQVEQKEALRLLAPLGMRQVRDNETGRGEELVARILESIEEAGRPLSAESLVMLVSLAQAGETSLPFGLVAGILEDGRLPWQQQLTLLGMYQESEEGERLLELVRAAGLDRGLGVLRVLHTVAERSGDTTYASDLQQRIEREEGAEKELLPEEEGQTQAVAMAAP